MAKKPKEAESEAAAAGDDESPGAAKGGRRKLIVMGLAGLLVLGGIGGGGYFFFFTGKKEEKVAAPVVKPPAFFDIPEVLVNLSNTGNDRAQYLKVKVVLELPDMMVAEQIKPVLPRVMDTFQVFLREFRLREELTRRVNIAIAPSKVTAVLFKEIVVQ
jgi:flagellar FliL protein